MPSPNKDNIDTLYQSALQLISRGDCEHASVKLKQCIHLDKYYSDAQILLGKTYIQSFQYEKAIKVFKNACTFDGFKIEAIANIAAIKRLQGHFEDAYQYILEKSKTSNPHFHTSIAFADICIELGLYTEAIANIENLLHKTKVIATPDKKNILHTLGKLYDKDKQYKKAFQCHQRANELTQYSYNAQQYNNRLSTICSIYSDEFLATCNYSNNKSRQPVFIVGMPRSGTTLLEQILSCHSEIHGAGEQPTIQQLVSQTCQGKYPVKMSAINTSTLSNAAQFYLKQVCSSENAITTDKMPHNYLYIGFIHQLFPSAKIINIQRQPIDNCLSIYFQYFNNTHRYATNLSNIAHHYSGYCHLLQHWNTLLPDKIINVQYENIIDDTQVEISKILKFLGLDWQDQCAHHYKNKRHVLTASQQQVNKPIYEQSIDRWKNYDPYITSLITELKSYNLI